MKIYIVLTSLLLNLTPTISFSQAAAIPPHSITHLVKKIIPKCTYVINEFKKVESDSERVPKAKTEIKNALLFVDFDSFVKYGISYDIHYVINTKTCNRSVIKKYQNHGYLHSGVSYHFYWGPKYKTLNTALLKHLGYVVGDIKNKSHALGISATDYNQNHEYWYEGKPVQQDATYWPTTKLVKGSSKIELWKSNKKYEIWRPIQQKEQSALAIYNRITKKHRWYLIPAYKKYGHKDRFAKGAKLRYLGMVKTVIYLELISATNTHTILYVAPDVILRHPPYKSLKITKDRELIFYNDGEKDFGHIQLDPELQ